MYILVLEASTTSAKAFLYDLENGKYKVVSKQYTLSQENNTKHNADEVYDQLCLVAQEIVKDKKISAVAISGTWHSLMLCNKDMVPETPVYLWSNTEASFITEKIRNDFEYVDDFYKRTGCMVNAIYPVFKLKMLQEKGYDTSNYMIMGQGDYITYRLTGEKVSTECMASGTGLMNIHSKEYDGEIIKSLNIDDKNLPKLVKSNQCLTLSSKGAKDLGIDEGIPVFPCNSDGGLNQVGSGGAELDFMTLSLGTSGAMRVSTEQPILSENHSTWCYLSPYSWLSGAATNGGCNCIDWFKNKVANNHYSYEELEKNVDLDISLPYFLPFIYGERCPGWNDNRKGGFENIKPSHRLNDLYYAVQEGVIFNLYQCFNIISKYNKNIKSIKFSGGILNSSFWSQMCVNIFKREMEISFNEHGSLIGGVVLAIKELYPDYVDKIEELTKSSKTIYPVLDSADFYKKRYNKYIEYYNSNN